MTKQAVLPAHADIVEVEVEIDAMDLAEWESGQRTPLASDPNLAELVRRTAELPAQAAVDDEPTSSPARRARKKTATLVPARRPPAKLAVPPSVPRSTMVGLPVAVQRVPALTPMPATEAAGARPSATSGIDFSLPVTATGERAEAQLPVLTTAGDLEVTLPVIVTSAGGAADVEPPPPAPPAATAFAEPSRVGPGHRSSSADSIESNTAWPPRPIPAGTSSSFDRLEASDGVLQATGHEAEGTAQLPVALTRRRLGWIAGTAGSILLGVIAAALLRAPGAGDAPAPGVDRTPGAAHPVSEIAAAPAASSATAGRPAPSPAAAMPAAPTARGPEAAVGPPGATAAPEPSTPAPRSRSGRHAAKRIAGKKVVVDYTARPSDTPPPSLLAQSEEDPAIGRARTAYTAGNQALFAGDSDGAIRAYQQALEFYPGYVGGYRGLGLAYAQVGDKDRALAALTTYVAAVPSARDVALIKKRIARLQGK